VIFLQRDGELLRDSFWGKLHKENPPNSLRESFFICPPAQSHAGSMDCVENQIKKPDEPGFGGFSL